MKQVLAFLQKEFRQLQRDPRMLFLLIMPPIVQLVLLGYAANLDVRHVPLVVCDPVPSATSRDLVDRLVASSYFDLVGYEPDPRRIDAWLDRGQATVALVFPPDFEKAVLHGTTTAVQLLVDGSETNTATVALSYASQIIRHALQARAPSAGVVPELRVWFNPALSSRWFIIPGLVGLLLTVTTTVLTALALVKEKETGTLEQLLVTPLRPTTVLLGKLVPFLLIGLLNVLLVVLVATLWFQVPLRGSIPLLFGCALLFLGNTLGLGLLISTLSRTQQQALIGAAFFALMPMIILSGFVFPIESMPPVIQALTYAVPLRYFLTIVRGIFLKDVGISALWDEMLALLVLGLLLFGLSTWRFRRQLY
ncbi:MAG: ABC transporter permease [Rhodothermus sp.]|nr:ABC transporter permease [Rhodothermus sp.]